MKTISIGRDESCDIVITDRTNVVSRRHAVITIDNSGKMTITDYSSNGTYVNGIKMSENVAVPITRKDNISFAHVFELDWNMVPNVRSRNIKIILGSAIAVIAIIVLIKLLGDDKPQTKPVQPEVEKVVVDTMPKIQPKVIEIPSIEEHKEQDIPDEPAKNRNKSDNNKNVEALPKPEQQDKNEDKDKDKEASVEDVVVDPIIF